MQKHKIDGCTSTMSSLFLVPSRPPPSPSISLLKPWNVCKIYSFFLCHTAHISPHTHAHSLAHSKLHTHPHFNLMPQFFGYYFNVFAHRNGETFWIFSSSMCVEMLCMSKCSHGVPVFLPFVCYSIFCECVCVCVDSTLGTFFGDESAIVRTYLFPHSAHRIHSLTQ